MSEATPQGAMDLDQVAAALESKFDQEPVPESPKPALEDIQEEDKGDIESETLETEEVEGDDEPIEEAEPDDDVQTLDLEPEQFAELLGLEGNDITVDDEGAVGIKVKVDGEESTVSLADLRKSYQLEGHNNRKSMELSDDRKAFQVEADEAREGFTNRLTEAGALVQHLEKELLAEFNAIDWNDLEAKDPGRFAASRQRFGERQQQLQGIKGRVQSEMQSLQQEAEAQQQADYQARIKEETQLFADKVGWSTAVAWEKGTSELFAFLSNSGFSKEEISQAADHRLLILAEKARKYDELDGKKKSVIQKKVKKAPKIIKPGVKQSKRDQERKRQADLKNRYKKTGRIDDLAAALIDRM